MSNRLGWLALAVATGCTTQDPTSGERTKVQYGSQLGAPAPPQTFVPLTNQPEFAANLSLVLPDGTVMSQDTDAGDWWRLTPDLTGSYINGTWTELASLPDGYSPLYYASAVLPDGRVIVEGGEYNGGGEGVWTTLGAIYDPAMDQWTSVDPPTGWGTIGDAQSVVLADGRFMMADCCTTNEAILDATSLTWTPTGTGKEDINDEEGWTLLPDNTLLTVDATNGGKPMESENYDPTTGTWSSLGDTPVLLADPGSSELGPAVLRPNGTVIATGATGHNAVYDTATKTWTAAPDFPIVAGGQLDIADGPGALMPNGNVLFAASPGVFGNGVVFFEWDGTAFNMVDGPDFAPDLTSYQCNLLPLPSGEIMFTSQSSDVEIYEPVPPADTSAFQPVVTAVPVLEGTTGLTGREIANTRSVEHHAATSGLSPYQLPLMTIYTGHTYTVSGTRLNGVSQGAAYGDDGQASTAFPLVRFTNMTTGHVQYARTHDGSNFAIAPTTTGSTHVDVPAGIEGGLAKLEVVASGVASPGLLVNVK